MDNESHESINPRTIEERTEHAVARLREMQLTNSQIREITGLSSSTISDVLSGKSTKPSEKTVAKLESVGSTLPQDPTDWPIC
jgi:transcriptional regulator with XRE-family HTH domain